MSTELLTYPTPRAGLSMRRRPGVGALRAYVRVIMRSSTASGGSGTEIEESVLIQRVRDGGPAGQDAYRILVERHQNWLVYFTSCLVGSRADAEDVAQEVFVRAFLAIDRFRGDARFKTWIRRIAINQSYNYRRSRKRHQLLDDPDYGDIPVQDTAFSGVAERQALTQSFDKLPYASREVLILHHVEQLTVREICEILDIGKSAAKMRLKRARDQFREHYGEVTEVLG